MLRTLRHRSSPALVVAIIALVAATAGTATAATKVLIKSSAQVRKGALDASDLSAKARKSLRGNRGPTGPAGPAGPAGATGAAGPAGARGPSEVFAARASGLNVTNCPVGGCDPDAVLRTLGLPAGSFLVTASADLAPTTFVADASRSMECHLQRSDTGDFQRTLHHFKAASSAGVTADQTVEVSWALTLPAPTTLSLTCSVGSVKFSAVNARITALQVGSLTETVS
jgi:hypothetical protein